MSVTDVSIRAMTPDAAVLPTPIPHPRTPVDPPVAVVSLAPAADVVPHVLRPTRQLGEGLAIALDSVMALSLAVAAAGLGRLPVGVALAAAVAWPLLLLSAGRYRRAPLSQSRLRILGLVLGAGLRAGVLALAVSPWLVSHDLVALAELVAVFSVASAVPPLVAGGQQRSRLVLAGRPRDVREALRELEASGHEVVAACLTRRSKEPIDLPTYVGFGTSAAVVEHHGADVLVLLPGARLTPSEVRRLHWSLSGVGAELYLGTGLLDVEPQRTRVVSTAGFDVLHVTQPVLHGPKRLLKDVVERTLALLAFLAALPLLAALCVAIRIESPGPALFRQERVGRNGAPFTMLKLRSMGNDAEAVLASLSESNEKDSVLFKMQRDPRITPLGAKLRRYSLDELPQLWNVVRGDMSLVGPRPALPSEVAQYDFDPRRRLVVKPGVTGLWQVSGRSELSWAETVRLDLKYVDNWSLGLDLRILVRTVRAVLGHRGAF